MTSLASAEDVAHELGLNAEGDLTDAQAVRIPSLLTKASFLFRQAAGKRQFTPDDYVQRLMVVGGRVRLPEAPVSAVATVVDDSGNNVAFTRVGEWINVGNHHGNLNNSFGCYQPDDAGSGWFVTVAYTGGEVPDIVRDTVAQVVARQLGVDPIPATGVKSHEQTLGPITERKTFFDWAADAVTLTDEECAIADSFRYAGTNPIIHRGGHARRGFHRAC